MTNELQLDELFRKLREPFPSADVDWRIGQAGKNRQGKLWAKALAYLNARSIQDRLDMVVGPANWQNTYEAGPQGGVKCGLSLRINGEWITKWDGAENTDFEAVKGGMSDAMKRAAVQWGVGRYLYELGEQWAVISDAGSRYTNCKIKVDGKEDWVSFNWEAPKLPEFALPDCERKKSQPSNGPINGHHSANGQSAAVNGTSPSGGKPQHSESYAKAATAISDAKTVGRLEDIRRGIPIALAAGRLSEAEADGLNQVIDAARGTMVSRSNPTYVKAVDAYVKYETSAELLTLKAKLRDPAKGLSADEIAEVENLVDRKILSMPQAQQQATATAAA